ncbi:MAG: hypothetical protein J6U53_01085 [Tidjanibacter sp.]|nr:hypothetical protein [Tidjanibacter sp.]
MKTILTPAEVLTIAFGTTHTLREGDVPEHTILATQRKFLRPVLGEAMFEEVVGDSPSADIQELTARYLKTPLALYTASLLLPTIAMQVGAAGVVRVAGESFRAVDNRALSRLSRRLRSDASALLDSATDYLASHPDRYPLYDPKENIRERILLKGGIVVSE